MSADIAKSSQGWTAPELPEMPSIHIAMRWATWPKSYDRPRLNAQGVDGTARDDEARACTCIAPWSLDQVRLIVMLVERLANLVSRPWKRATDDAQHQVSSIADGEEVGIDGRRAKPRTIPPRIVPWRYMSSQYSCGDEHNLRRHTDTVPESFIRPLILVSDKASLGFDRTCPLGSKV